MLYNTGRTIIINENLFFYIQLIIYETFKQITSATCMHTHFSQCALPYLWSIFGFYQRTDLVSNLMPFDFFGASAL